MHIDNALNALLNEIQNKLFCILLNKTKRK